MSAPVERIRLDKWLWQARFFKTRGLAAEAVGKGRFRVNAQRVSKPGHGLKLGDVLTFALAGRIRVVEVIEFGDRRGPAREAAGLYRDLDVSSDKPAEQSQDAGAATDHLDAAQHRP